MRLTKFSTAWAAAAVMLTSSGCSTLKDSGFIQATDVSALPVNDALFVYSANQLRDHLVNSHIAPVILCLPGQDTAITATNVISGVSRSEELGRQLERYPDSKIFAVGNADTAIYLQYTNGSQTSIEYLVEKAKKLPDLQQKQAVRCFATFKKIQRDMTVPQDDFIKEPPAVDAPPRLYEASTKPAVTRCRYTMG